MIRSFAIALGLMLASPALAGQGNQLRLGVVNHVRQLDHRIVVPELNNYELAQLKFILDDGSLRDDEKRAMIRNHLRLVEKFGGDTRGVIFGFGRLGVRGNN